MRTWLGAVLALFCSFSLVAYGQNATTSLRGVVTDPTGAFVPGATVTLLNKAAGQTLTTKTQNSGEYQLQQIPPATYTITVTAAGFGAQTRVAQLLVNQPATVNVALTVQSDNVVLEVTESAQSINTTDASLGDARNNEFIQAIPSETRNVPDLLAMQPGVIAFPPPTNPALADSRSGSVNGGRSDQGNITVDGIDDNDQVRGLAFFGVLRETQDSVEEFRVTTGNANADAGRSSGAQVSLITKAGTNRFHGAAYEYFRPSNTVSNDYFNKQAQLEEGEANRPPKLIRNVFGADIGGPIFKDKLFFFFNYEGTRKAESSIVQRTTPTAAYQQGILSYEGDGANGTETDRLTPAQVAQLDAGCTVCNTTAYPNPPGPDPNAVKYFAAMPAANGALLGDFGYNTGSYTFASPNPQTLNTSIFKIDWTPSSKHRIFARGNLQKDTTGGVEQFPGQGPNYNLIDNTKGIAFGDTWTISPNIVNDIRYGFIRQGYGQSGAGKGDYVDFRYIDTLTAETRSTIASVPVNNIIDNFTVTKGKHTMEFGVNWRLIHQNRSSDTLSYNNANSNPTWLDPSAAPQPDAVLGLNPVDPSYATNYKDYYANLVGDISQVTNVYNYQIVNPTTGNLLPDGALISRHFSANEYEGFAQDQWRITPKLTMTFGARYTVLQTPWETHGQQVTPTIDTHAWFQQREASALQGQIYEPLLNFTPSGRYYGRPGFFPKNKDNVAPRFAIAYAPDSKTSIRAGAGIYYDHFGEGLINIFDQNGEFGLSSSVTSNANAFNTETAPRFVSRNTLPFSNGAGTPTTSFPYAYPTGTEQISFGIDNKLKTPYTEAFDLSLQREIPGGFTVELAYVGRLGRHLLQSYDLAEPVDFTDPQGGGDYFSAGTKLSKIANASGDDPTVTVQPIPYFEHVFPFMANTDYPGESATQAIYSDEWAYNMVGLGQTTTLSDIDYDCAYQVGYIYPNCPANYQSKFFQGQFDSLFSLATIGMSYYNSAQVVLRHPSSHGYQVDVAYTFSKSIDMGSDAERTGALFNSVGVAGGNSIITDTWKPALNRAVSDFDTKHLLTVDWLYQLPFGRGKAFLANTNWATNALVGGWQFAGAFRATSGLPFSLYEPGYTTNWTYGGYGVVTDPSQVKVHKHFDAAGDPLYFDNADAISGGAANGTPMRVPYPGEAGQRNLFRGDGYLDLDGSLSKAWAVSDKGNLRFTWEVYNVTNTTRFDPLSIASTLTYSIGTASTELTQARRMQFSLRYDF